MKTKIYGILLLILCGFQSHSEQFTVANGTATANLSVRWGTHPATAIDIYDNAHNNTIPPGESRTFIVNSLDHPLGIQWSCDDFNTAYPVSAMCFGGANVTDCAGTGASVNDKDDGGPNPLCCCGMPVWGVSEPYINLWLHDEPLGYQPALGPRVSFKLAFKQRDPSTGFNTNIFGVGKKWNLSWLSYITQDSQSNKTVHYDGGRQETVTATTNTPGYLNSTTLTGDTTNGFAVLNADGSKDVYGFIVTNNLGVFQQAFMTERRNPQGNKITFNYYTYSPSTPVVRLQNVVDGDGRTTLIYYNSTNAYSTNLISSVVDAFGRSNSLAYDSSGHLTGITDVGGISATFAYDGNDWVKSMVTPYGTNTFQITDSTTGTTNAPNGRSVRVIQPDGGVQLYLCTNGAPGVASSYASGQIPSTSPLANNFDNVNMDIRNTFHWGPLQYASLTTTNIGSLTNSDFLLARMQHWLLTIGDMVGETLSMKRDPSPDSGGSIEGQKTWYDYAQKYNASFEGGQFHPLYVAQVLPDGTTSFGRNDRNSLGNVLTNIGTYSSNGVVALRTNGIYTYDSINGIDLIAVTNALNVQVLSNGYAGYHVVLTNYDALNQMTVYRTNANQQITSIAFSSGLISTNVYESDGWLATNYSYEIVGGGTNYFGSNIFTYANDLVLTHTDARSLTTTSTWDNLQRLIKMTYPDSTFVTNTYTNLDLAQTVDRMGFSTSYGYDSMRRLVAETNANSVVTRYGYCSCGSLNSITNAFGTSVQTVTQFSYDNQGNRTYTLYPGSYSVTSVYDSLKRITNVTDSAGVSVTNWFNNQGLQYAASNYFGQVFNFRFDILDRTTNSVDANGVTITNTYDNLNRVLTRTYPDTGREYFGYSARGLIAHTNQLTNVITYIYDAALRKTSETNANTEGTQYTYSPAGDLLALTDGRSQTTTWRYDLFGEMTNKTDAASNIVLTNFYDADWRLTQRWSAVKGSTSYSYDNMANLTGVSYNVSHSITLAYDALNRLTSMIDGVGTNTYSYDDAGQLLSDGGLWINDTVNYSYTNRLRSGLSLLQPKADAWTQTYGYDGARRLTGTASPAGSFAYAYDGTRQLQVSKLTLPSGAYITNTFDNVARLTGTTLENSANGVLNFHGYSYNVGNQRIQQVFTATNYMNYAYDKIGQLASASGQEATGGTNRLQEQLSYGYDAAHNLNLRTNNALVQTFNVNNLNELTTATHTGTVTVAGTVSEQASNVTSVAVNGIAAALYRDATFAKDGFTVTNGSNLYTAIAADSKGRHDTNSVTVNLPATVTYTYDLNGNLLSDGTRAFDYDDENELIRVTVTNAWKSEFTYDGKLRRRIRYESTWNGSAWVTNTIVRYVYDGNVVIQERDGNNLPLVTYTRGNDLSGTLQSAVGIGGLLARTDMALAIYNRPATAYYHADGNGNITVLINAQQVVVAKYLYDPYGAILSQSGPLADANLYRFSSEEFHANSGLVCYPRRLYDPNLQRWLNRDPLGEAASINLYGFVGNSALNLFDPLGYAPPSAAPSLSLKEDTTGILGSVTAPGVITLSQGTGILTSSLTSLAGQQPRISITYFGDPNAFCPDPSLLDTSLNHMLQDINNYRLSDPWVFYPTAGVLAAGFLGTQYAMTGSTGLSGSLPAIHLSDGLTLTPSGGFNINQDIGSLNYGVKVNQAFNPLFSLALSAGGSSSTTGSNLWNANIGFNFQVSSNLSATLSGSVSSPANGTSGRVVGGSLIFHGNF